MRYATNWSWALAVAAVLFWSGGCDDSSSGGGNKLILGNMMEDSIDANGTNSYKFTTTSSAIYQVNWDMVSTGDPETLVIVSTEPYTCALNATTQECLSSNTLAGATTFEFDLTEISGVDTTFRIGVQLGP